jgi:hypothetical protein
MSQDLQEFLSARTAPQTFPLKSLIALYFRAKSKDVYCDWFAGFKLLHQWLGPIEVPQYSDLPEVPRAFWNYELQEISKIVQIDPRIIFQICKELFL